MQSHFNINEFPDLWAKVKAFVNVSESRVFAKLWVEISNNPSVPQSFMQYIRLEWLSEVKMWSLVMRKHYSILEEGNTNMLLKAYVFHSSTAIMSHFHPHLILISDFLISDFIFLSYH